MQQLKIAMTPSTPHPPYHPFDTTSRTGNHLVNSISSYGMNNGNVQNMVGGNINYNINGATHRAIPSTPSVMSGLEKWGQDR